ncbi:MAG: MFS transporter [Dehalococcoidia bacterium]
MSQTADSAPPTTRPRFFYGWVIVGVCFLAQFGGTIAGQYGLTVLLVPMSEDLGWSRTSIVGASIPASITAALVSPFLGRIANRYGSRWPMALSGIVGGVTTMAIAGVHSLWVYYLIFGIVNGVTRPMVQVIGISSGVAEWFVRRRAFAAGLVSLGIPISGIVGVPLAQYLVIHAGWRATWFALGAVLVLLVGLPAAVLWRPRPESVGLLPDGDAAPAPREATGEATSTPAPARRWAPYRTEVEWTPAEAVRTRAFWALAIIIPLIALAGPAFMTHVIAFFLSRGLSPQDAAIASTSFIIGTFIARFVWAGLSDRYHIQFCYVLLGLIGTLGTALTLWAPTITIAYGAVLIFGVAAGGMLQLRLQIWPDYFGRSNIATLRGYTAPFDLMMSVGGPFFAAWVYDRTHSYHDALLVFAILGGLSTVAMLVLGGPPRHPGRTAAGAVEA